MAVKRSTKKSKTKVAKAYEEAMAAEGAPVALDLLGFGSTISNIIRGRPAAPAKKTRARKARVKKAAKKTRGRKASAKAKTKTKTKTKSKSKTARRKKRAVRTSRRRR